MTTITTDNFRRIEADTTGFEVTCTASGVKMPVALTADERRTLAAALTADQGGEEVRDTDVMRRAARSERAAERHWPADQLAQGADTIDSLRTQLDGMERERDAAVERADQAEARIEGWREAYDALSAGLEALGDAERDRDEWKARAEQAERERDACGDRLDRQGQSIATLQGDFLRVERERNEAVARAEQAENARDTVATRAGQLEKAIEAHKAGLDIALDRIRELKAKPNVAVSRADIEKALRECTNDVFASHAYPHMADAVCDLFGIEAEQAVDPVEKKAREIAEAMALTIVEENIGGHTAVSALDALARSAARRVLGQEADHA